VWEKEGERGKGRWARGRGKEEWAGLELEFSFFFFSKIMNSTNYCLFHRKIFIAPKILQIFV
jgi:hypothetical protein